jgi:hypothetical protein
VCVDGRGKGCHFVFVIEQHIGFGKETTRPRMSSNWLYLLTAIENIFWGSIARSGVTVTRLLCDPLPYKNVLMVPHAKIWEKIHFRFQYKM